MTVSDFLQGGCFETRVVVKTRMSWGFEPLGGGYSMDIIRRFGCMEIIKSYVIESSLVIIV